MGDAGYQSDAPAEGPMAGYDQPLGKKKRKVTDIAKRLRKEGYMNEEEKKKLTRKERAAKTRERRAIRYDQEAWRDAYRENSREFMKANKSGKSPSKVLDMLSKVSPTDEQQAKHRRKGVD